MNKTSSREMHSSTSQRESADGTVAEVAICLWTVLLSLLFCRLVFFSRLTFFTKEETFEKKFFFFSFKCWLPKLNWLFHKPESCSSLCQ